MATPNERAIAIIEVIRGDRSINQFGRDIGMDPGQLWRILNGGQKTDSVIVKLLALYPDRAADIAAALAAPDAAPVEQPA